MVGYLLLALAIIAIFLAAKITRKETAENGSLTKKGIIQLVVLLAIVFFSVVTYVFVSPESWI